MSEMLRDSGDGPQLESTTVGIYRTAAVVKGGRRFSFAALVVVGDRNGKVGLGYGKATGVPAAIEKAQKDARKQMFSIKRNGTTIPHPVAGKFGASNVRLIPAAPGTGVVAGATVRAVLEMVGITDCMSKSYGSNNQKNLTKAVLEGLRALQTRVKVNELRSTEIEATIVDEKIALGERFMAKPAATAEVAPVNAAQDNAAQDNAAPGNAEKAAAEAPATEGGEEAAPAANAE